MLYQSAWQSRLLAASSLPLLAAKTAGPPCNIDTMSLEAVGAFTACGPYAQDNTMPSLSQAPSSQLQEKDLGSRRHR